MGSDVLKDFALDATGVSVPGIFITTGTFTTEAYKEALREGAPPIELVDAEKLVSMFEQLRLGLKPKTVYEVDEEFFNEFS